MHTYTILSTQRAKCNPTSAVFLGAPLQSILRAVRIVSRRSRAGNPSQGVPLTAVVISVSPRYNRIQDHHIARWAICERGATVIQINVHSAHPSMQ
jgi:hypothetical protein